MRLLIATHNQSKAANYRKIFAGTPFEVVSLADLDITDDVEETGTTFEDNALLKAEFFHQLTGLPTLADDAGLEIDALDGAPGIHSRRWKGHRMTGPEMAEYALKQLDGVPLADRTAQMTVVVCMIMPGQEAIMRRHGIEGHITESIRAEIDEGYPFRSIFHATASNKLLGLMSEPELKKLDHRKVAVAELVEMLDLN